MLNNKNTIFGYDDTYNKKIFIYSLEINMFEINN